MALTLVLTLFLFLVFIILFSIIGIFKKAIYLTFIIFIILLTATIVIIFLDTRQLVDIQTSKTVFIYTQEEKPTFGVILNFSEQMPYPLTIEETTAIYDYVLSNGKPPKKDYFKVFIFSNESLGVLLPEEIYVEDLRLDKKELLRGLQEGDEKTKTFYFTTAIIEIFQNIEEKENLIAFLNQYKKRGLIIAPPIKAISILAQMPLDTVEQTMKIMK